MQMDKQGFVSFIKQSISGAFMSASAKEPQPETEKERWFRAVQESDIYALKHLLKLEFPINQVNERGRTALMIATYNRDEKTAAFLIEQGADVNNRDDRLNSPFLYAAAEGYLEILKLMGSKGDVKVVNRYGGIGIIPASERAHLETLEWLLKNTASDVNHVNNLGWTALLEAIILGDGTDKYVKTVQLLLRYGASPDIADRDGVTPIEHAEKLGYTKILKLLEA